MIYIGSFSKTILPTIRLGFLIAPPSVHGALLRAKQVTDWHSALPLQAALAEFIEIGAYSRHIRKMREIYRARREMIVDILTRDFSEELRIVPSIAGIHITALARTASAEEISAVVRRASEAGVEIQELSALTTVQRGPAGIMFGYGAISTTHIPEGLRRLRTSFAQSGSISAA